jgi:hypothetical protein
MTSPLPTRVEVASPSGILRSGHQIVQPAGSASLGRSARHWSTPWRRSSDLVGLERIDEE